MNRGDEILAKAGVADAVKSAASYSAKSDFYGTTAAPKVQKPNVLQNIGKSLGQAAPIAGQILNDAFVKPFQRLSSSVSGVANTQTFLDSQNYQRDALNKQIQSLSARYRSRDPKVKISKEMYQQRLSEITKQFQDLSKQNKEFGDQLGTPIEAATAAAEVATMPLAFGKLAVASGAGLTMAERVASKIPSIGAALSKARPAMGVLEGATAGGMAKDAAKALIKQPLLVKPTTDMPIQTARDVKQGKYGDAALNTALMASGVAKNGPLGIVGAVASKIGKTGGKAVFGSESLYKGIKTSDGTVLDYVKGLERKAANGSEKAKEDLKIAQIYQQYKLDETKGNVPAALRDLEKHYANLPTSERTGAKVFQDFKEFYQNTLKVKTAAENGKILRPPGTENLSLRVGRFSNEERTQLQDSLKGVDDPGERFALAKSLSETADWGKNPIVKEDILNAVSKEDFTGKIPLTSLTAQGEVAGLTRGYFPIFTKNARAEFKAVDQTARGFDEVKPKVPALRGLLRKTGLSPEAQDPSVYSRIEESAVKKINEIGIDSLKTPGGSLASGNQVGPVAVQKLMNLLEHKIGATDIRQLGVKDIATELNITVAQARKLRGAVHDAHFAVSLGERGLGSRIQDLNLKFNPLAAPYSRVQGVAKYELNPFFRLQTNIETEVLGQGLTGGNTQSLKRLFGKADAQSALQQMNESGFFAGERSAGQGLAGPFVSAKLTSRQKRMLAGTAQVLAENRGLTVSDLMKDAKVRDELRAIVQYPERGIFSSNLAKSANLAFFPISYNLKVATLAAKYLSKQSPVFQVATIKGANDFNDWLGTDDGIKWQSKNSEALGLISYFTPANSINSVMNMIGPDRRIADFGMVGGLPFGVLTQILQDHGALQTDRPYTDPKTGEVVPQKIPNDLKASLATTITDIVNSMYNFPGRQIGADTSKKQFTQGVVPGLKGLADSGAYTSKTATGLSPKQVQAQKVLAPTPTPTATPDVKLNFPKATTPTSAGVVKTKAKKGRTKYVARQIPTP